MVSVVSLGSCGFQLGFLGSLGTHCFLQFLWFPLWFAWIPTMLCLDSCCPVRFLSTEDHGEGIPIAWAISNREDTTILVQFLKAVHNPVDEIETSVFMSNCAEQYFSALRGTFITTANTKNFYAFGMLSGDSEKLFMYTYLMHSNGYTCRSLFPVVRFITREEQK